jgi:NAD(P)H-dependent FMN reductase
MTSVLAISGSLRAASHNTALLRAAREHSPDGVSVTLYQGLAGVPPYNGDLDDDRDLPAAVADLRARIDEAGVLHDPVTIDLLRTTLSALRDQIATGRARTAW